MRKCGFFEMCPENGRSSVLILDGFMEGLTNDRRTKAASGNGRKLDNPLFRESCVTFKIMDSKNGPRAKLALSATVYAEIALSRETPSTLLASVARTGMARPPDAPKITAETKKL